MGDPRRLKKKYQSPGHPWQKSRIEEESVLSKEYGLKNKKEIYKMDTKLKLFRGQAKRLIAATGSQADIERAQLFARMERLGLLPKGSSLADILSLTVNDVMNRRLQTLVVKNGLARTVKQARQFITHQHITVGGKVVSAPSYLVTADEESSISFIGRSKLSNEDHPERKLPEPKGTIMDPNKDAEDVKKELDEKESKQKADSKKEEPAKEAEAKPTEEKTKEAKKE